MSLTLPVREQGCRKSLGYSNATNVYTSENVGIDSDDGLQEDLTLRCPPEKRANSGVSHHFTTAISRT